MQPTMIAQQLAAAPAGARSCASSASSCAAAYLGNAAVVTMWTDSTGFAAHVTTKRPTRLLGGLPT